MTDRRQLQQFDDGTVQMLVDKLRARVTVHRGSRRGIRYNDEDVAVDELAADRLAQMLAHKPPQ